LTDETRLKRLRLRSWRRGIREMDLLLGRFADARLEELTPAELDLYEALLEKNDQDLYAWTTGREAPPAPLAGLVGRVAEHARRNFAQQGIVL
jgi:antitoxin CptB